MGLPYFPYMGNQLLGIRIPENLMNKLQVISDQNNETPNQLGKRALVEWIEVLFTSRNLNMVIFPKTCLIRLLFFTPKEEMEEISSEIAKRITEYFQFLLRTHVNHFSNEFYSQIISKFLGSSGLMWFDHLQFSLNCSDPIQTFQATHNSGQIWTEFTFHIIKQIIIENIHCEIVPDSILLTENTISFRFVQKK